MERILVVCGAGASSTFLAHRMRALANARAESSTVIPASAASVPSLLEKGDIVLVGSHLSAQLEPIETAARGADAVVALLPPLGFDEAAAAAALDIARSARGARADHETLTHHTEPENIHG